MVRHTLNILQQMLQDFKSASHFGMLFIKGLKCFYFNETTEIRKYFGILDSGL